MSYDNLCKTNHHLFSYRMIVSCDKFHVMKVPYDKFHVTVSSDKSHTAVS